MRVDFPKSFTSRSAFCKVFYTILQRPSPPGKLAATQKLDMSGHVVPFRAVSGFSWLFVHVRIACHLCPLLCRSGSLVCSVALCGPVWSYRRFFGCRKHPKWGALPWETCPLKCVPYGLQYDHSPF